MRKFLILAVFTLKLLVANSQVDSVKSIITTKTIGQFLITTHDSIEVIVKVDRVKYFDKKKSDFDEADVSIRIEDKNEKVYYLRNLSTTQNALNGIKSIDLPGIGKALILVYDQFPCYGTMCCSFQIFGFNEIGYFVPFTGIIDLGLTGNAEMVANFKLKWMNHQGNEVSASKNASYEPSYYPADNQLYIEIPTDFILFEVKSLNYFPIYLSGVWYDNDYKQSMFNKGPIFYNNSNIIVIDDMSNERFKEPKILYTIPNTLGDYKLVNFKLNTTVKLIDMIVDSETWIHLEIDGVEGYMTYYDFSMSGFELSD
jgi:hypothetical protein